MSLKNNLKPLAKVAGIRSGFTFRTKVEPSKQGNAHIIQIRDVRQIHETENRTTLYARDFPKIDWTGRENVFLSKGDILLPARGNYFVASCLMDNIPTIASSQFLILTPHASILPQYLCWTLNQPATLHQIERSGTNILMLHASNVGQVKIPVPNHEIQKKIIALDDLWQKEQKTTQELLTNRAKQLQGIYQHLLAN